MAGQEKWYFTREQLVNSASRKCGLDGDKELAYRQQAANLIQDMGQRLQVSQLCINTAIVYMHRFYAFHSFTQFHRNAIAAAALFLAAKVEEQPRKLEYVIKVAHVCLHRGESAAALTPGSEHYTEQAQDLVFNENVLLQTLGFDVAIDHPHTHVVRTCHLVKAPKDLAQTSYFMASNSLHLTTMCLQYRPTVVACFCIHLASKWSSWAIPQSNEGKHWFFYVDRSVTTELLERLTTEFLHIFEKCPSRLRRKMMSMSNSSGGSPHSGLTPHGALPSGGALQQPQQPPVASSPFDPKKTTHITDDMEKSFDREYEREKRRSIAPGSYVPATTAPPQAQPQPQKLDFREYREKREREERERRQLAQQARPAQGAPRPAAPAPAPHHPRSSSQHHHNKPHHPWPHQKPPHHAKPPHDHRHHRPQPPGAPALAPAPAPAAPVPSPAPMPAVAPVQETPPPQRTRPPSLFSPENATAPSAAAAAAPRRSQPPPQQTRRPQPAPPAPAPAAAPELAPAAPTAPVQPRKRPTESATAVIREMQPPAILSPFSSPPAAPTPPQQRAPRPRSQSSSEPELVPVVKKLDDQPGYENVIRDSQRGASIRTRPTESRRIVSSPRAVNGIETDPALVSNLLKESLAKPAPITVPERSSVMAVERELPRQLPPMEPSVSDVGRVERPPAMMPITTDAPAPGDLRHRSEKKKKKEKHKHKDRDKPREERKKHKKDKDKEKKRESSPMPAEPPNDQGTLRLTIPRDKLSESPGLKIKIPKERLAVPPPPPPSALHAAGIRIKIPKEVLETSRKRSAAPEPGPPQKAARHNGAPHHGMPHKVAAPASTHAVGNGHGAPK